MRSMVSRTRSRITHSMVSAPTSRPSPGPRFLLSLPTASSSGTRCPAGTVVGQLRRMMTPSFHFSTTRPTLPHGRSCETPRSPLTARSLGFLVGSPTLIAKLAKIAEDTYISAGYLAQATAFEYCRHGLLPGQIDRLKMLYAPQLDTC